MLKGSHDLEKKRYKNLLTFSYNRDTIQYDITFTRLRVAPGPLLIVCQGLEDGGDICFFHREKKEACDVPQRGL